MVATALAPPAERDFEIYRLVEIAGASTREVAALFELSQTRIVQLRDRVAAWVMQQKPLDQPTKEQRLQLAQWEAGERLRFLYQTALDAWRRSQGPETIEQKSQFGAATTTRMSQGKTAYLNLALKVAERLAKLPLLVIGLSSPSHEDRTPPSEEDCSVAAVTSLPDAELTPAASPVIADEDDGYDAEEDCETESAPAADLVSSPVQPPVARPLNRRERKRRERQKQRALGRGKR